jgi:hypothetical protein
MYTANTTASKGRREWWTSPSRSRPLLIISPIEYRHLRTFGRVRIVSGIVLTGLGTLTLSFGGNELTVAPETDQHSDAKA